MFVVISYLVLERLYYLFEFKANIPKGQFTNSVIKSRVDSDRCSWFVVELEWGCLWIFSGLAGVVSSVCVSREIRRRRAHVTTIQVVCTSDRTSRFRICGNSSQYQSRDLNRRNRSKEHGNSRPLAQVLLTSQNLLPIPLPLSRWRRSPIYRPRNRQSCFPRLHVVLAYLICWTVGSDFLCPLITNQS